MSEHFGFLTAHGFVQDPDRSCTSGWGTTAVYRAKTLAIEITKSIEFVRVEVRLVRLVDGEFPEYDVFFEGDKPLNRALLDNVVIARRPDLQGELESLRGLRRRDVARQLAEWARTLRTVAPDVLEGSTVAFDDAKRVIADHVEENPQRIVVWLPEEASAEREADAIENARRGVPESVSVVARRYRR